MTSETTRGRVAVGMSGGLDSSVAAMLLADAGWEVIGLSLHMFKEGSRCCSIEDVNRARRVCEHLGLRHYTMNVVEQFREAVVRPFAATYAAGRTPNPCIFCNRDFKFGALMRRALDLGCSHVATGHYVRVDSGPTASTCCAVSTARRTSRISCTGSRRTSSRARFSRSAA